MDWDNLRYFLELTRANTLVGAARRLEVDHTTVARRLQALEKQVGAPLFVREAGGHRLTEAGRQLLPAAEAMESAISGLQKSNPALAGGASGLVRIGAPEGLGTHLLAPELARLTRLHPALSIDLLALPRLVNLSRREADIVISLERPARGTVVVSRLSDYVLCLYGEREYLARRPLVQSRADLVHHDFISYVDDLLFTKELQLLDELHRPQRFAFRSTSIVAQYAAVRAGAGLAVLPAFLADSDPVLQRVLPEEARFTRTFWMSMPQETRHLARLQVTWAFLRDAMQGMQGRLRPA